MISVLLSWAAIFLTAYPLGAVFLRLLSGKPEKRVLPALMCGLVCACVYAEIWSLFSGVSGTAFFVFALPCALCWFLCIRNRWVRMPGKSAVLLFLLLALALSYFCSRGYIHYDTDLYHAQAIRWIEEAGCVPGLANLHNRLGYNSSAFALTALYSFSFLGMQSFHTVQGFMALILAAECLRAVPHAVRKEIRVSDFVRIAGLYYLFSLLKELSSPTSDSFMVLTSFYLLIRTVSLIEDGNRDPDRYALLAMLAVYDVTIKLSAAMLVLLCLPPVVMFIRKRNAGKIGQYIFIALLIAIPFLARNVILTGYLLYPYPQIDLFDVPWKVPEGAALADQLEIQAWGRGYRDYTQQVPPASWAPSWFSSLGRINQLFLAGCFLCIPAAVLLLVRMKLTEKRIESGILLYVLLTDLGGLLFWFAGSPLIRYGCFFVYSLAFLSLGILCSAMLEKPGEKAAESALCALLFCFLALKMVSAVRLGISSADGYWIWQKGYGHYEVMSYQLEGITFYYPSSGDQCGYDAFPSSPTDREGKIRLLGDTLKSGFAPVQAAVRP